MTGGKEPTNNKIRVPGVDDPKNVVESLKAQFQNFRSLNKIYRVPKQCDVLVVGGGLIGSFVAYWLKTISPTIEVAVIEKDSTYVKSSTFWSLGGFRQQFSLPENIKMSLFGSEFIQKAQTHLKCLDDEQVDLPFNQDGYLFLANKKSADALFRNHQVQIAHHAKVKLLNKEQLKSTFGWLNTDDLELGSFGYFNEGWVDPRKYLLAVRNKASFLGAEYVNGEVVSFEERKNDRLVTNLGLQPINTAIVDTFDNKLVPIKFKTVVNAAGPWAAELSKLAGIGSENDSSSPLSVGLPVEPRKRYIYMFYAEEGPILKVPLTIDHSGVFIRRQGLSNFYFCGLNQSSENETANMDLNHVDYDYFEKDIKPVLINRIPTFKNLRLVNAWSGYYEYNTLDQNLIIGPHPIKDNFIFTNGSSGHGLQHSAAIGRAVSELILYGSYQTIDLKRFGFERVLRDKPIKEIDVV